MYTHTHIYTCMHVSMYLCLYVSMYVHICGCVLSFSGVTHPGSSDHIKNFVNPYDEGCGKNLKAMLQDWR